MWKEDVYCHDRKRPPLDVMQSEIYTLPHLLFFKIYCRITLSYALYISLAFPTRMSYVFIKFLFWFVLGLQTRSIARNLQCRTAGLLVYEQFASLWMAAVGV
jgi:hypothetical protein